MSNIEVHEDAVYSVLKIRHIVVDKMSFDRNGFRKDSDNVSVDVGIAISKDDERLYRVALSIRAQKPDKYTANVQMSAYCEIAEDEPLKEDLLKKNAVAILFPYIRAQLTLLTSQPETDSVVLPALNINKLIDQAEKASEE